ncbi:Uncharacterised protein [Zhongshania aliphaticivorans]|nr:Uncharacterised protein [Zhongshania aliphaticivorans]
MPPANHLNQTPYNKKARQFKLPGNNWINVGDLTSIKQGRN